MRFDDKKGISPVIATVMLIALVIVIALLIWVWYGNFYKEWLEKENYDLDYACVQDVSFTLSDVQCLDDIQMGDKKISFSVENKGGIDIKGFKVIYSNDIVSNFVNTMAGVNQAVVNSLSINPEGDELAGLELELTIIPIIGSGIETKLCDLKTQYATISC